jgi:hypothetical protein
VVRSHPLYPGHLVRRLTADAALFILRFLVSPSHHEPIAADRSVVTLDRRIGPLVLSDNRHLPRCTRAERRIYAIFTRSGKPATKRKLSEMRRAKNFHPEWDYVPAANRFVVAMAIGAIAGGGVVLSLVDVPTGQASVAAHTLSAPARALINAPERAQPHPQPIVESTMDSRADDRLGAAVNESSTNPEIVEPPGIAPLTEVGPNDASVKVATPPSVAAAPAENKTTKNRRVARHAEPRVERGGYGAWGWGGSASHLY